jgi:hypothetical protein
VALVAVLVGCSGDSGGTSSTGGAPGEAGSASGGSPGTGSGGATGGGSATGGSGPDIDECEGDPVASSCDVEGTLCNTDRHCCRCSDLPDCGLAWECALIETVSTDCPMAPPGIDSECPSNGLVCQYCTNTGPLFFRCSRVSVDSETTVWGATVGLACAN